MTVLTLDATAIAELYDYLTPAEKREVDYYATKLTTGQPHTEYRTDPIRWAVDKLSIREDTLRWRLNPGYERHIWDGTPDPMLTLFESVAAGKDTGVESATGTGKSFGAAILALWFPACFENGIVFTFAPKEDQLKLYIWKHIGEFWPAFQGHFPNATLTDLKLRMRGGLDESWGVQGHAVGIRAGETVSTKASGMHAKDMLLIYEEMQGIDPQVIEAGENACTAPHNFRLGQGNPNHRLDTLHKFSTSPGVTHIRISALDHPNVVSRNPNLIPGAVSQQSIDRRRIKYTETSPVYQSRVLGYSPEQASDALIRYDWLIAAKIRYEARQGRFPRRITGKGVDVANSEHGDRRCIVDFAENVVIKITAEQCPDANALGRLVALEMDAADLKPQYVGVDTIGVGAGTFNELARLRKRVQSMCASAKPILRTEKAPDGGTYEWAADGNVFRTQRDQWYWQAREDLRLNRIDLPFDAELWEELLTPTFVDEPKTIVEAKDEIRESLGRSPDKADAFVMANWVRQRRGLKLPENAAQDMGAHDPAVLFRTVDGKPARWIGPDSDREQDYNEGYASQLPAGI